MKKVLKITGIVLGSLLVLGVIGFFIGKSIFEKLTFQNFSFADLDLHGLSLQDIAKALLAGDEKPIDVTLAMEIKNENNFSIPFCYLNARLFYRGTLIATTSEKLALTCYGVPANGVLTVSDRIKIILNKAGGLLILDKFAGKKPKIDYEVELSAANIPSLLIPTIKNNFAWE